MRHTTSPELKRTYHLNYVAKPDTRLKLRCREQCAYAIKVGKLVRLPCEKCGSPKSEAHHEDYSKPLVVKWLCRRHHGEVHRKSHCIKGHALAGENVVITKFGSRQCRQCHRDHGRNQSRLRRAA